MASNTKISGRNFSLLLIHSLYILSWCENFQEPIYLDGKSTQHNLTEEYADDFLEELSGVKMEQIYIDATGGNVY